MYSLKRNVLMEQVKLVSSLQSLNKSYVNLLNLLNQFNSYDKLYYYIKEDIEFIKDQMRIKLGLNTF